MTDTKHIAALEDLRVGVEMDRHSLPDGDVKLAALDAAIAKLRVAGEPVAFDRDGLMDLIAEQLSGTYHCTRVWSAWGVGTMSQDDFEDVGESDTPGEIADAIMGRYTAPPGSGAEIAKLQSAYVGACDRIKDLLAEKQAGNDAAPQASAEEVPRGCKLVPIEPTESMVIAGFESAPDQHFSPREMWDRYQAMTGCEQAAHRARLCWAAMLAAAPAAEAQASAEAVPLPLLAADHTGMRVDYSGLLKQARGALQRGIKEPALAEMLRQLTGHLTELGQRWYAGDTAVVDEILQLYCIEGSARESLKSAPAAAPVSDGKTRVVGEHLTGGCLNWDDGEYSAKGAGDVALPQRDPSKPAEAQGLFRKFIVSRVDGSDEPGGKHHGCRYFVLDVDHDQHAAAALAAYAASCEATHPELARDLREKCGAAAEDSAKGAGDLTLPPLPKDECLRFGHTSKAMQDYAHTAVLADRQQRGGGDPLWVFAQEVALGAYSEDELRDKARAALAATKGESNG